MSCTSFPANASVHIASNTIFGAKSVEFIPPQVAVGRHRCVRTRTCRPRRCAGSQHACFSRSSTCCTRSIPVELNGTLSALSEGLRGHGDDLGGLLSGLNTLTQQLNPKLPALQQDFARRLGDQRLRGCGPRSGHRVRQHCRQSPDGGGSAEQSERHAAGHDRACLTTPMTRWRRPSRTLVDAINTAAGPAQGHRRLLAGIRVPVRGPSNEVSRSSPRLLGVRKAGLFTSSSFVLGRAVVHLSREPCRSSTPPGGRTAAVCRTYPPSRPAGPGIARPSW
jgi:phospholipid/cholesterol/gamma-HCH transport system substrate-binding protein